MNDDVLAHNLRRMANAPSSVGDKDLVNLFRQLRDIGLSVIEAIDGITSLMNTLRSRHARPAVAA